MLPRERGESGGVPPARLRAADVGSGVPTSAAFTKGIVRRSRNVTQLAAPGLHPAGPARDAGSARRVRARRRGGCRAVAAKRNHRSGKTAELGKTVELGPLVPLSRRVREPVVQVFCSPAGLAAQPPCFKTNRRQETVNGNNRQNHDDDVHPPHGYHHDLTEDSFPTPRRRPHTWTAERFHIAAGQGSAGERSKSGMFAPGHEAHVRSAAGISGLWHWRSPG